MVESFRITKYDPALRDDQGAFHGEDWTSSADIGRVFSGVVLTVEGYLEVEQKYVTSLGSLAHENAVGAMRVVDLEKYELYEVDGPDPELERAHAQLAEGAVLTGRAIQAVIRLALREGLWCRLESLDGGFFIHFGYDYYTYAGSYSGRVRLPSVPKGIFIERYVSPHHDRKP